MHRCSSRSRKIVSVNIGDWHFEHVEPDIFFRRHVSECHLRGPNLGKPNREVRSVELAKSNTVEARTNGAECEDSKGHVHRLRQESSVSSPCRIVRSDTKSATLPCEESRTNLQLMSRVTLHRHRDDTERQGVAQPSCWRKLGGAVFTRRESANRQTRRSRSGVRTCSSNLKNMSYYVWVKVVMLTCVPRSSS